MLTSSSSQVTTATTLGKTLLSRNLPLTAKRESRTKSAVFLRTIKKKVYCRSYQSSHPLLTTNFYTKHVGLRSPVVGSTTSFHLHQECVLCSMGVGSFKGVLGARFGSLESEKIRSLELETSIRTGPYRVLNIFLKKTVSGYKLLHRK